jgi:fermentation-respiration switch protein FrsA (DUF1100 family)
VSRHNRGESKVGTFGVALLIAGGVYLGFSALLFFNQERLLFLPGVPTREVMTTPSAIDLPYEPVTLTTVDGERLDAWLIPAAGARATLLFCHGNAGNISHRLDSLRLFHDLGLTTLIFDYRGYGRSTGRPSEAGTYRDAEAAWQYLTQQRRVPAGEIILFGRSLGAAVVAELATHHRPAALIVESAFTSVPEMAAHLYPYFPARWLARLHYATVDDLPAAPCPVLVVHSREDEIIPFGHGERLYAAAREPKRLLELHGDHNGGFLISRELYLAGLDAFLRDALREEPAPDLVPRRGP